ncbi:hypothetical protein [Candidatus Methylobacter favarea]|uniref:hypothetical protein n=1 Tax=Candidatus Methylobacter favarea TaxID=2707345 RepID=UPI001FEADC5E|nr:hypothetical protein [Candidatus Methylobacter favarea]
MATDNKSIPFNDDARTAAHHTLKEKIMRFIQYTLTGFLILLAASVALAKEKK